MKLDPRIEGESLIHTPFSKTQVKLSEKGYFAGRLESFQDLKGCVYGELAEYNPDSDCPYWGKFDDSACPFSFYIPESSLKEVKPLTLEAVMKEISELRDELHAIKYQLNKSGSKVELTYKPASPASNGYNPPFGFNQQDSFCTAINPQSNWCTPGGFNPQSNWCK